VSPGPQVAKYIDIPLQHINNLSLLRMNRPPRQHTEAEAYTLPLSAQPEPFPTQNAPTTPPNSPRHHVNTP